MKIEFTESEKVDMTAIYESYMEMHAEPVLKEILEIRYFDELKKHQEALHLITSIAAEAFKAGIQLAIANMYIDLREAAESEEPQDFIPMSSLN